MLSRSLGDVGTAATQIELCRGCVPGAPADVATAGRIRGDRARRAAPEPVCGRSPASAPLDGSRVGAPRRVLAAAITVASPRTRSLCSSVFSVFEAAVGEMEWHPNRSPRRPDRRDRFPRARARAAKVPRRAIDVRLVLDSARRHGADSLTAFLDELRQIVPLVLVALARDQIRRCQSGSCLISSARARPRCSDASGAGTPDG